MLKDIFKKHGIEYFGVLPFNLAEPFIRKGAAARRLPENAKSIIVALFPYLVDVKEPSNISLYAVVEDYHKVAIDILNSVIMELKESLPGVYTAFTDNSPFPEVSLAAVASLGKIGKNSLLINEKYGSFVFIGEIVTDVEIEGKEIYLQEIREDLLSSLPKEKRDGLFSEHCESCGRCVSACPGNVIGKKERESCLSFITQKKGELSYEEEELIKKGELVWGCDICQKVCPQNKGAEKTPIQRFYEAPVFSVSEENADELCLRRAFGFRGSGVIKRNISILEK